MSIDHTPRRGRPTAPPAPPRRGRATVPAATPARSRPTVQGGPARRHRPGGEVPTHAFPPEIIQRAPDLRLMPDDHPASDRGGQGALYTGRWDDGRPVLVKVYHGSHPDRPRIWRLWQATEPAFAVPLLDARTFNGADYEVTEYLPAGSLSGRIGALHHDGAERVLGQITEALDHFHQRLGVVAGTDQRPLIHGDVKPANILVSSEDPLRVCLTDFGAARVQERARDLRTGPISLEYAAPELWAGEWRPEIDWWALGVSMLVLLQGHHPYEDDGTWLSEQEMRSLTLLHDIDIAESVPLRWHTLLRGLLTRVPHHRWRAEEVRLWLRGVHSPVLGEDLPDEESAIGFVFAGRTVHDPRRLAALIATGWREGGELVAGARWQELLRWSSTVSSALRARLGEVNRSYVTADQPVDRSVAELLVRLDPHSHPNFRGYTADPPGLMRLAAAAEAGQGDAIAAVTSLHDCGGLRALSRLHGQSDLDVIDERWQRWTRRARGAAATALGRLEELPRPELLTVLLLQAAVDQRYLHRLAAQARSLHNRRTQRVGWFRRLVRQATGRDAPALHAVIVLAAGRAEEPQLRAPDPGTELAQRARELRDTVDAEIHRAGPPPAPDGWLPAAYALPRPGPRRFRTRAERLTVGWLLPVSVLAYTALVTVAATGVAVGTSTAQGVLTGVLLLLTGGCLAAGLALPRSPLTETALGAVAGVLAGLPLAGGMGTAAGLVAGPLLGWPTFWITWVIIVVVGAGMGAAEWNR